MNINDIAEIVFEQLQPSNDGETAIDLEDVETSARAEFAYQSLLMAWREKREEGYYTVPSYLLKQVNKDVEDDEIDISDLKYFKSLPNEVWLQDIGGAACKCRYVKSNLNLTKLLCGDDSMEDDAMPFLIVGNKIKFPNGAKANSLPITYADMGDDINGDLEIDDAIAAIVRERLLGLYTGKIAPRDETNNQNSNN